MNEESSVIAYRAIRNRATGELVTAPAPIYAQDFPYGGVSPQQPLLRYMDLWKFEDLLSSQSLFFCRADKFKDPLEGTISKKEIHGSSKSDVAFAKTANFQKQEYEKAVEYRNTAKACTFVNCWHINNNESQAMWDAYTETPASVLVISTAMRLASSLKEPVFGSAVKYVSEDDPRTEFDGRSLFFYKDLEFDFEREFRLLIDLIMIGGSIQSDNEADFFRRVPVDLSILIHAIQLHPQATQTTRDRVASLVCQHLPSARESSPTTKKTD
jgi:hypothetical protein